VNTYQRNADGAVINPPVIANFEQQMHDAQARVDFGAIIRVTAAYNAERDAIVKSEEGPDSKGLGWTDDDMRGGLKEDDGAYAIRPKFPDGSGQPIMPAGMDDAMLAEQQQLRGEMRELRALMAQLAAQGQVPGAAQDAPTPHVEAAKPTGATTVTAGPSDAPTPFVSAAQPTGLMPGEGGIPDTAPSDGTDATGATDSSEGSDKS
jgi:hypothetical protein